MQDESYDFYEPQWFGQSPTYRSWVKLFIRDCFLLTTLEGFEGTKVRFWKNHPIRWLQLVGIVISINIRSSFTEIELDDGSGNCISLYLRGKACEEIRVDFERNRCALEVGDLIKVKGSLATDHRAELQLIVEKIDTLTSPELEYVAWEERVAYKKDVLDKPWVCDMEVVQPSVSAESRNTTNTGRVRRSDKHEVSLRSNAQAQARETAKKDTPLDLTSLDARHHTQRNLKVVLLQHFAKHSVREFSIRQLRGDKELEQAVLCVARHALNTQRTALGHNLRPEHVEITSTQRYRTMNACLAELVRDGSVTSLSPAQGTFSVVGRWNLGVLMLDLMSRMFAADSSRGEVTVREMWLAIRETGHGFESVSKHMVQKILEDLHSELASDTL